MSKLDDILMEGEWPEVAAVSPDGKRTIIYTHDQAKQQIKDLFDSMIVEQFSDTGEDVAEIRQKVNEL